MRRGEMVVADGCAGCAFAALHGHEWPCIWCSGAAGRADEYVPLWTPPGVLLVQDERMGRR